MMRSTIECILFFKKIYLNVRYHPCEVNIYFFGGIRLNVHYHPCEVNIYFFGGIRDEEMLSYFCFSLRTIDIHKQIVAHYANSASYFHEKKLIDSDCAAA